MKKQIQLWTLDGLILAGKVKLGRGNIISKKDIANFPGNFPIYSSAREKNGTFGYYGKYMFDEELITWSIDGGGRLFYRPRHKFSVTNVGGTLRILDTNFLDGKYLHLVLTHLHSKIRFDWVYKAHPSVIRMVYNCIPIPSLEKQREIVQKLNSAFSEIDKFEGNLSQIDEKLEQVIQSLLSASFTDWASKPDSKDTLADRGNASALVALKDFCKMYQPPTISTKEMIANGKYVVYGANGLIGRYDKFNHEESQLLVTCRGATCGAVNMSEPFAWINGNAMVIQPNLDLATLEYMKYAFLGGIDISPSITGSAQPQITRTTLEVIKVPLPSLEKQHEIVKKLDSAFTEIESLKSQFKMERNYAQALRQSILSSAFTVVEEVA